MNNFKKIQSTLKDQKKGVGFVLVKNAVMKNAKGNFQSSVNENTTSSNEGGNFTILGIVIVLALMKFGPEIIDNLNSKHQQEFSVGMTQMTAQIGKAKKKLNVSTWLQSDYMHKYLAENSFASKISVVPDNDSQFLNQLDQNERLLTKLKKQNQDIQNEITKQNEKLEYLEGRENNREVRERLRIFGNILLNL